MTRCWMLTFWGKPRNQHLYDHAHESPILWLPLAVLAIASIFGGNFFRVRDLIESAQREGTALVKSINSSVSPELRRSEVAAENYNLYQSAWSTATEVGEPASAGGTDSAHEGVFASEALHEGHETMEKGLSMGFAWLIGIGLGFFVYLNGYWIAAPLMRIPPLNWLRIWLYRRMYFDELYHFLFVDGLVLGMSAVSNWFDKYIIDGIVNGVGKGVKQLSVLAGLNDRYIVDGAVNGVAVISQDLGAAVRAPQTGRIRMYVTVLMVAVTLGLAGVIIVALSLAR
jgi:NADH-quinone oxidoreductase subunit L